MDIDYIKETSRNAEKVPDAEIINFANLDAVTLISLIPDIIIASGHISIMQPGYRTCSTQSRTLSRSICYIALTMHNLIRISGVPGTMFRQYKTTVPIAAILCITLRHA